MLNYFLDPGHGDRLTPGKRSPEVGEGVGIYEGEFNRAVCAQIQDTARFHREQRFDIINIAPGPTNVPLAKTRVPYVNRRCQTLEKPALISVHANAAPGGGWSDANGYVVYCSEQASDKSVRLAGIANRLFEEYLEGYISSRGIKRANHTITTKTLCPAILVECAFMTNRREAAIMATWTGVRMYANLIYRVMAEFAEGAS